MGTEGTHVFQHEQQAPDTKNPGMGKSSMCENVRMKDCTYAESSKWWGCMGKLMKTFIQLYWFTVVN